MIVSLKQFTRNEGINKPYYIKVVLCKLLSKGSTLFRRKKETEL